MNKSANTTKERIGAAATMEAPHVDEGKKHGSHPPVKTKLEKTQSLLTVISTSIGLLGMAGSVFAMGLATFYTGTAEVRPDTDAPDVVVRVYTKEGHESVYHTKHIELMPGSYHLEISSAGSVVHRDIKIRFHKTNNIPVHFDKATAAAAPQAVAANPIAAMFTATPQPVSQTQAAQPANTVQPVQTNTAQTSSQTQPAVAAPPAIVANKAEAPSTAASREDGSGKQKRRWWQLWRRTTDESSEADSIE